MMVSLATETFPSNQFPSLFSVVTSTTAYAPTSICCTNLLKVSSLQTHQATWEDPEDGSGSEYDDEDEEMEEGDLDFESDWEEERNTSAIATNKYEEDLVKEVEQLLEPEERVILQQNAVPDLSKISTAKWSPLQTLVLSGQIHFMDKLLKNGLNIDMVDKALKQNGLTALHKAFIGKKEAVINHLLRRGASPHDGATPLHYAVQFGAMQTVKLLIKYKVDVNAADNEGWTPLHIVMQSRSRDIAKVLLVDGADMTRRNKVTL
ncbi:hypothetical protein L1049_002299 [Liquidambar formosana]|uniref:Ankyrin repeat domain-containing protein EMB506, chloroplastic n=1 Tax=Liquidambar formosana TaxID=63359 RepID=A0AAP0R8S3_LIQFO